jgi:hypothetical protein
VHVQSQTGAAPIADAWVQPQPGEPQRSDRVGLALLPGDADSLLVWCRGYLPQRLATRDALQLLPVHDGVFLDRSIVLDPFGSGLEPTDPRWGVSPAQLAFDLVARLETSLAAAGARVTVTRGPVEDVADLERARLAGHVAAHFYIRIETSLEPENRARLLHYPNSRVGNSLATSVGAWLLQRGVVDSVTIDSDPQPILMHTPCPALVVRLPVGHHEPGPQAAARHFASNDDAVRQLVYALQLGLRAGLRSVPPTTLGGRVRVAGNPSLVPEAVLLDRTDLLTLPSDGAFRFDGVAPGRHELIFLNQGLRWEHWITTVEGHTDVDLELQP